MALTFLAAAVACGGEKPPAGAGAPGGGAPAMPVEVLTLTSKPIPQQSEYVGTVKSRQSTTIQPQAEGFLTKILVKSGDHVAAGAPMFEIDSTSQRAAVANLESVRAARQADVTLARQRADRAKALLAAGAGTQQDVEASVSALDTALAQQKALEAQIAQQQNELSYYRVTAPAAGVVGDIPVRQGDRVTRQTPLTTLDSNTGLEIYIGIPVQQAPQLKVGLPVEVVDAATGATTTEKITFVSPSVDDATQTVLVKAAVTATKGLRTDQFVTTRVLFSSADGITVPITAVLRINGQYFVYTAQQDKGGLVAHQRQINVGGVVGNDYVVQSGLKAGEQVIVSGIQKIGDGAPVQAVPAATTGGK